MCKKLIKNSQPFGKNFQKTLGGIFLTHTVDYVDNARVRQTSVWWGKQVIFELNASISRQRLEISLKLLLITNRNLYMSFPLAPSVDLP